MGFLLDWLHFCCSSRRKIYYLPRRYKFMSRLVARSVPVGLAADYCMLAMTRSNKPRKMGGGRMTAKPVPKVTFSH